MQNATNSGIIDPYTVFPSNMTNVKWTCRENPLHQWMATFKDRAAGKCNCPVCNDIRPVKGFNTFADRYPELVNVFSPKNSFQLDEVMHSCTDYGLWICPDCNNEFSRQLSEYAKGNTECPYCTDKVALAGYNSLADLYLDIAALWSKKNNTNPENVLPSATTRYLWECPDCNGTFEASVNEVVANPEAACPYCNDRLVLPGFNSFDVRHPDLMEEYLYVVNDLIIPSDSFGTHSQTLLWWKCPRDDKHTYQMTPADKIIFNKRHREPCPYCRGFRRPRGIARAIKLNKKKSLMD